MARQIKKNLKKVFWESFQRLPLFLQKAPLLLGVSGGPDSTVLAHVALSLCEVLPQQHWAHVNYRLRIPESDQEEAFLRDWAEREAVPFKVLRLEVSKRPANLQDWARNRRLRFFAQCLLEQGGGLLALAHHQGDQAETVLERMIQGCSLKGLGAMAPLEPLEEIDGVVLKQPLWIWRPWLEISQKKLLEYANKHQLDYHLDQSNQSSMYLRNRVRHELLPGLLRENPRIQEALGRLAIQARQVHGELHRQAEEWLQCWARPGILGLKLPREPLSKLSSALRNAVLELWLRKILLKPRDLGKYLRPLEQALENQRENLQIALNSTRVLRLDRSALRQVKLNLGNNLIEELKHSEKNEYFIKNHHETSVGNFSFSIQRLSCQDFSAQSFRSKNPWLVFIEENALQFPLRLTQSEWSERFTPLGMKGSKSLGKFLKDKKISKAKAGSWVLYNALGIPLWFVGQSLDDRAKVTQDTKRFYRLEIKKKSL